MEPLLFAISVHTDQKYGEYPYLVLLGFVNHYVNKYKHLLSLHRRDLCTGEKRKREASRFPLKNCLVTMRTH